jgi:hypothetical protein
MLDAAMSKVSNQEAVVDLHTRPHPATANKWPPPSLPNTRAGHASDDPSLIWAYPYS